MANSNDTAESGIHSLLTQSRNISCASGVKWEKDVASWWLVDGSSDERVIYYKNGFYCCMMSRDLLQSRSS